MPVRPALPLALLPLLAGLSGCPGSAPSAHNPGAAPPADEPAAGDGALDLPAQPEVNYPPMVLEYIQATLRDPATDEHAGLAVAWEAVSRLADGSDFAGIIGQQMQLAGNQPPIELASAWLATDPAAAAQWLVDRVLVHGTSEYLNALQPHPALGRQVLARLDLAAAGRETTEPALLLLRSWEPLAPADEPLLQQLAKSSEPRTRLRAIGYLAALGKASDQQLSALKEALRSEQINTLAAAAEACRIGGSAELAQVLVLPAALIPLGSAPTESPSQSPSTGLYTAYALSYLPGEQAKLLRQKLLGATDPRIRWQARLGELLHGDIKPWYDAVLNGAADDADMWLALQPPAVADPGLLLTYKQSVASENPELRVLTAQHLNRYGAFASEPLVKELLEVLVDDEVEQVAAQAWHSAALIRLPGLGNRAQQTLDDASRPAGVRLAAGLYQLLAAEPNPAAEPEGGAG